MRSIGSIGRTNRFLALVIVLLLAAALPSKVMAQDYILGEGDLLRITVYENDDLTTMARVSGDGKISFPLVGELELGGQTVREAQFKLTKALADGYIKDPHVTIFVAEYRSKKVTILGEVSKPGLYELSGNITLLELISRAGGLTADAGITALIQRKKLPAGVKQGDEGQYISVNLKNLMEKGDLADNKFVQDGDSIFVTKSGFVYVTGEVSKPGAYKVEDGTTVMKVIALAGGFTDKAAKGRTNLIRKVEGKDEEIDHVDLNLIVKPDDLITVPESYF